MLRSLFSGISGLRAHQQMMDVTGNNIANVNTTGYKASQTTFQDTLSQLVKAAGSPQPGAGGTNPAQVGLGVRLAGIQSNFSQGAAQNTGRDTDLMIQGDGFFAVQNGGQQLFTRNGSFSFDANGSLVTTDGSVVQGWTANAAGAVNTNAAQGPITLPLGTLLAPKPTQNVTVTGNLPADTTSPNPIVTSITTYDTQGNQVTLTASFTKVNQNQWTVDLNDGGVVGGPFTLDFTNGATPTPTPAPVTVNGVTLDLSGMTSYSGLSTVAATSQDGSAAGTIQSFTIAQDGTLTGVFSNGLKQPLAQLAIASFSNPAGLEKAGDSTYRTTANSGNAQLGTAGSAGRGVLQQGALEMSNVDLSQEFTNLVIAERGFQANSRVITTSDEILQDLVNIKHCR
jgi:flagellar hook protein FlgE